MNEIFKRNPNLLFLFRTSDGTHFYENSDAINHGKTLKDRSVVKVGRNDAPAKAPKAEAPKSKKEKAEKEVDTKELTPMAMAKLRVEAIEKLETVAEIEKALEGETAKTVLKAGAERIAAIQAEEALNNEDDTNVNVETN